MRRAAGARPPCRGRRRDRVEAGLARCARAALAHDELVGSLPRVADDDRLQDAELTDAVHELGEVVGVEVGARLARVRDDRVRVDVHESRAGDLDELGSVTARPLAR